MLSVTNTVIDVKARLSNSYLFYGYTSDDQYDADLEIIADDVYRQYFVPRIGSTEYTVIQTKDKVDLTETETNLYWAEVFTICFEFLRFRSAVSGQLQNAGDEELTVEGYTHKVANGNSGGASQGDMSIRNYRDKMYRYWKLSGFNISAIQRTCDIFSDSFFVGDINSEVLL